MRPLISKLIFYFVLLIGMPLYAAPIADQGEAWSKSVKGIQGRISFEQGAKVNKAFTIKVFLELRNVSEGNEPIEIFYDPSRSVAAQLLDEAGKLVIKPPVAASVMIPLPYYLVLPKNSTLRLDISANGYTIASNQKFYIELYSGVWAIDNPENYYLETSFTAHREEGAHKRSWSDIIELPRRRISFPKKD